MSDRFLDPNVLARVDNFELLARNVVEGYVAGLHRGLYHGFGSEFVQYRHYNRGDDLKYVDWKAYARLNRLLLKVYQEETNCNCYVVLDVSSSMAYGGAGRVTKLHYGKMVAACLAYMANRQGDNAGLFAYSDKLQGQVPAGHRSGHIHRIAAELTRLKAGGGCDHGKVLSYLAEHFNRRGLIVMISDFLDPDEALAKYVKHFRAAHHDLVLFHILDDDEIDFDMDGTVRFVDSESSTEVVTSPIAVRERCKVALKEYLQKFETFCRQHEVDYCRCRTSEPLDAALAAYLNRRESFR